MIAVRALSPSPASRSVSAEIVGGVGDARARDAARNAQESWSKGRRNRTRDCGAAMVGATGIEPVTPAMSRQCSTAELRAHRRKAVVYIAALWPWQVRGLASMTDRRGAKRDAPAPRAMTNFMEFSVGPITRPWIAACPSRQTAAGGRGLAPQRIALSRRLPGPGRRAAGGAAPRRGCLRRRAVRRGARPRHSLPGGAFSALLRRCQPRALRARSRHVRGPAAAAAQSPHDPGRGGPGHDSAGGGQRRGDLSRPRAVQRDRAAAGNLLAALSCGAVEPGRADLCPVRRRAADRCPFHAVLGLGPRPARARQRRHRAGRQSRRGLRAAPDRRASSAG